MSTKRTTKTQGIEPLIIEVMVLRLKEHEALSYLSERGYDIGHTEYYSLRNEVQQNTQQRLNLIASKEFLAQHLERIETLKTIHSELWNQYHAEQHPTKKAAILMNIAEMQTYLSSYYDQTQYVVEQAASRKKQIEPKQE